MYLVHTNGLLTAINCFLDRGDFRYRNRLSCSSVSVAKLSGRISCNQTRKSKRRGKTQGNENVPPVDLIPNGGDGVDTPSSRTAPIEDGMETLDSDKSDISTFSVIPSRNAVLQACTVTSGFLGAIGFIIREVSHSAAGEGWPINDCSEAITFNFEMWHLELIVGSIFLVSSCRLLLLRIWPDFAESSETANKQVLTSLEAMDYLLVAFLPGISEELLFRGALLPLLGINWSSVVVVASLFGILHLGGGRRYSFAIWATFVGLVYGYTTMLTSSVTVSMTSHALNNLVGGIAWRYHRKSDDA